MAILEEYVDVAVGYQTDTYYEALGYNILRRNDSSGKLRVPRGTEIRVKVIDLPTGSDARVTKVCDICGKLIRQQSYKSILRVRDNNVDKCNSCAKTLSAPQLALQCAKEGHSLKDKRPEVAELWHPTRNGDLTPSEVAPKSGIKAWWLCREPRCAHAWEAVVYAVTTGSRCPACNMPKGERRIREYLRFLGYRFTTEEQMDGLTGESGGLLRYDVAVKYPTGECALLIEFDGEQHEIAVEHFGGEAQLARQQEHDRRKDEYARNHEIPLLRIKHNEYDLIEHLINEALANIIRG